MLRRSHRSIARQHRSLTIKFQTRCSTCTALIDARKKAFLVVETKEVICTLCMKLLKEGRTPKRPTSPAQRAVDRLNEILDANGPIPSERAEFERLVNSLKVEYAAERLSQSFLADLYEVVQNDSYKCMAIRRADYCNGCAGFLASGTVAAWEKSAHRIWCLDCASDFILD